MQRRRNEINEVDAILTSDWHLREDQPVCRMDDFWAAQWNKVGQVSALQRKYGCSVMHAGDLFHHWKPSPYLLSETLKNLPENFVTCIGQHDIPQHNMGLLHKSGIEVLNWGKESFTIGGVNWGEEPNEDSNIGWLSASATSKKILLWHRFVWDGKKIPWPDCDEMTAEEVLDTYPEFDLIVTGDHHKPFTYQKDGRLLVNPGCLTRQAVDYADHRPRVYLWDARTNTVREHYLDVAEGIISREHIEVQRQRDERIEAFVSRLDTDWELAISFEENLARFFATNRVRKSVQELTYKAIEL